MDLQWTTRPLTRPTTRTIRFLITGAIIELVYNPNGFILFHKLSRLVSHRLLHDVEEVPFHSDTLISIKSILPPLVSPEEVVTYLCKVVTILRMSEHYDRKKIKAYLSSILQGTSV